MNAEHAWIAAISLLLLYETYALAKGKKTLSRSVWEASRSEYGALIPFFVGFLMGHFFWCGK